MDQQSIQVIELLDQLDEILLESLRIPFTGNRIINEQDTIDIISDLKETIPTEFITANQIVKEANSYIESAKKESSGMIELAKRQQKELVDKFSVRQEAERQVAEIKLLAKQKTDKLIRDANHKASVMEHDMQVRLAQLEQQYAVRRSALEKDLNDRIQKSEQQNNDFNTRLQKQQAENSAKAINQLEAIKLECLRLENQSKKDSEANKQESFIYQQQVKDHCEKMLNDTRNESALIHDGANRYAHQTLMDLESKVAEISQVITSGKKELSKVQNLRNSFHNIREEQNEVNSSHFQTARNTASRIKQKITSNF